MIFRHLIFLLFCLISLSNFSQNQSSNLDSLKQQLKTVKNDGIKIDILLEIARVYPYNNPDTCIIFATQALELATKINDEIRIGKAYTFIGWCHQFKGNYPLSLNYSFKAMAVWDKLLNNPSYKKRTLVIKNKSSTLNNIGNVYYERGELEKALGYFKEGLKAAESVGFKDLVMSNVGNIGIIYDELHDTTKALQYYHRSLKLHEEAGDKNGIGNNLCNIGTLYDSRKNNAKAKEYYTKSLKIFEEIDQHYGVAVNLSNIGNIFMRENKLAEAESYFQKGLLICKEIGNLDEIKNLNSSLSILYQAKKDFKKSLLYYKEFISIRDSLTNEENIKKTVQLEMQYNFDKKEASSKLEQEKKEAISFAENKKQKTIIWSACCVLVLVIGFAGFAYRSSLQKQKANTEITKQKITIEVKQKEIIDSIHYAKRIQTALMTNEKYIDKNIERLTKEK